MKNKKQTLGPGVFCEVYGFTISNMVLEYALCSHDSDFSASEINQLLGISKPMIYSVLSDFLKKSYIKKTRIIGKTQLYTLNKDDKIAQIFLRNFNECLNMVAEEYSSKKSSGKFALKDIRSESLAHS